MSTNLSLLDELIALGHGKIRSPDCLIAIRAPELSRIDVHRAQKLFPKTGAHPIELERYTTLQSFLDRPLPTAFHLELALIEEGNLLTLKMSHVLGDAVSMFLFLRALLGLEVSPEEIVLKSFPRKKDTPYRKLLNSTRFGGAGEVSSERRYLFASVEHGEKNFPQWNDRLLLALLEALPVRRKGIWVPVNVRKNFWAGFGNGLSRLRIYPPEGKSQDEKLAHIRRQKQQALRSGEVSLPPATFHLRSFRKRFLYQTWVRRPWADWCSLSLSHLTNSQGFLDGFEDIHGVSNLMPRHNAALFAVTHAGKTDFTLTFDPRRVSETEARQLLGGFLENLRAQ